MAYLTLLHQLGTLPFFGSDEPRYAQIAKEMHGHGDLITPTLEGRPWLEKPPLLFWMLIASFSYFGPSEWSARLPNAFLALVTAISIGAFTRAYRGLRCGFLAFLILTTSLLFVGYSRAASTDLPMTAAYAFSMIAGFR
ncbi:MAG: ArnT family glycosyltransferase, partial [bacterium]